MATNYSSAPKALDCCAGAGGLSLGLQRAGFDVHGVELDPLACETHRNQVGPCDCASLWDYSPQGEYELVAGGIPCQSHSNAGKRGGTCDPRGQLYVPFLRIAREAKARAVLIENVRGILTSKSATHGTSIRELVAAVSEVGYPHCAYRVLNAADYGVPQTRHRVFLVAFSDAFALERFRWPHPTHAESSGLFGLRRWVSVREALGLGDGEYDHGLVPGASQSSPQGMRRLNVDAPATTVGVTNAELLDCPAPTVTATSYEQVPDTKIKNRRKFGELRVAMNAIDRPAPCVTATEYKSANDFGSRGARTNARRCGDQLNPLLTELAKAGCGESLPATTVDTSGRHHAISKHGAVRLTVKQMATLQSFPEGFTFSGKMKDQHRQVGNAVPPPLAEAIGRSVLAALGLEDRK